MQESIWLAPDVVEVRARSITKPVAVAEIILDETRELLPVDVDAVRLPEAT